VRTGVLVLGGGAVTLKSALFMAQHRVPRALVERHPGLLIHPRSRGLTARTRAS
jgi:putative polyketide hydroxylase